jgi:hypothetical protein
MIIVLLLSVRVRLTATQRRRRLIWRWTIVLNRGIRRINFFVLISKWWWWNQHIIRSGHIPVGIQEIPIQRIRWQRAPRMAVRGLNLISVRRTTAWMIEMSIEHLSVSRREEIRMIHFHQIGINHCGHHDLLFSSFEIFRHLTDWGQIWSGDLRLPLGSFWREFGSSRDRLNWAS